MGNVLSHKKIIIEYDTWEPFKRQAEKDLDDLVNKVKTKELLSHCGNIHLTFEDKGDIK
jgi:hypothetical protein